MELLLVGGQVIHKGANSALVVEIMAFVVLPQIGDFDSNTGVQESQLSESFGENFKAENDGLIEDFSVGIKLNPRSCSLGIPANIECRGRCTSSIRLLVVLAISPNVELQPLRQSVHTRHTHTVKTTGHLVGFGVKLSACMKHRQHNFRCGSVLSGVHRGWNSSTVVFDRDGTILVNFNLNEVAIARQGFIDGVVHHLVDAVMEPAFTGVADVHGGAHSNRFQSFKNLDGACGVVGRGIRSFSC